MGKLKNLYTAFLDEKYKDTKQINDKTLIALISLLKNNLTEDIFSEAEELLTSAISNSEETGFNEGVKYLFALVIELSENNNTK